MRLTVTMFVSLDGVAQGPGGPDEDRDGGFGSGGWVVPFVDEDFLATMGGRFGEAGAFLLGRRTYEMFAGYWPAVTDPADPIAAALNALPKHVVSTTLTDPAWAGTAVLPDLAAVARLKAAPGCDLQTHGSTRLVHALARHGLVDEYQVWTFPVVLGGGKRLFEAGAVPAGLRLTGCRTTRAGVTVANYEPAGAPEVGYLGPE
ncbi:dihydrofolate reductase family protein [Actinosynnema sp. NPDC047251]|nr:dihydrofolate reductase family protein [Saccharothrix espanaensis]